MKRRVIKQGNNTLTITLPRDWCDRFAVKAGDELQLDESKQRLVVSKEASSGSREIKVDIPKDAKWHRLYLVKPYIQGYDKIHVTFHDRKILEGIQRMTTFLIGFEITAQGEKHCTLSNIANGIETEFDGMHTRLHHMAADMLETCADIIEKKDYERLSSLRTGEETANRLMMFCRRMINKMQLEQHEISSFYTIDCQIEAITDFVRDIGLSLQAKQYKVHEGIPCILRKFAEQVRLVQTLERKKDWDTLSQYKESEVALDRKLQELAPLVPQSNVVIMMALSDIKEALHTIGEEL